MAIIQQIRKIIQNNILSRVSCFRQKSLKNFDIRTLIRKRTFYICSTPKLYVFNHFLSSRRRYPCLNPIPGDSLIENNLIFIKKNITEAFSFLFKAFFQKTNHGKLFIIILILHGIALKNFFENFSLQNACSIGRKGARLTRKVAIEIFLTSILGRVISRNLLTFRLIGPYMELTPLDIRNQAFHKKNFGGVDGEEVKAFLETAATAFEQMSRDRTDLTERLKIAEQRVSYYKQIEKTIQDAVVTMQKTVDEVKATAEKEAEIIIAEAKARAVREVENTKREAENLRMEIERLKQLRSNYFIRFRALIHSQEELLTAMENDQSEPEDKTLDETEKNTIQIGNVLA